MREYLIDYKHKIGSVTKTSDGYYHVQAPISKVGILQYLQTDGSIKRVFVPKETLMDSNSIETIKFKPITNGHPKENVSPSNYKKLVAGSCGEISAFIDPFVMASFSICSDDAISDIQSGKTEISAGYTCEVIPESGEYNGEKYDYVQRNRIYDHIAIVYEGRAGHDVSMNFDEKDNIINMNIKKKENNLMKLDGKEMSESEVIDLVTTIRKDNENLKGQLDAQKIKLDEADAQVKKIPELVSSGIIERNRILLKANLVLDEKELKPELSDLDIQKLTIAKVYPELKLDSKTTDYINGVFESINFKKDAKDDSLPHYTKTDESLEQIRAKKTEMMKNAWKGKVAK